MAQKPKMFDEKAFFKYYNDRPIGNKTNIMREQVFPTRSRGKRGTFNKPAPDTGFGFSKM